MTSYKKGERVDGWTSEKVMIYAVPCFYYSRLFHICVSLAMGPSSILKVCLIHVPHEQCEPLYHSYVVPYTNVLVHGVDVVQLARVESTNSQSAAVGQSM